MIKVSIIIPTYMRTDYLNECLDGLRKQTYDPLRFETIVIDDSSPNADEKKQFFISQSYPFQFRYFTQSKGGPAKARNFGARESKGEIIVFLDDDAVPTEPWLESLVSFFEQDSYAGVGGTTINYKTETLSEKLLGALDHFSIQRDPQTKEITFLTTVNAAFTKKIFVSIGGFDENFTLPSGEDLDLGYRLRENGFKLGHVPKAIVRHHEKETVKQMLRTSFNYGRGMYRCHNKHKDKLNQLDTYAYTKIFDPRKFFIRIQKYFQFYGKVWRSKHTNLIDLILLPNLNLVVHAMYLLGRWVEARKIKVSAIRK